MLAASDDAAASRVLVAVATELVAVRLTEPMTEAETRLYIATRLEQAGAPETQAERLNGATVDRIVRLSGGVPRRVHELVTSVLDDPRPTSARVGRSSAGSERPSMTTPTTPPKKTHSRAS